MRGMKVAADVDAYIAREDKSIQKSLKQLRTLIKKSAPKAEEKITYGMPGYKLAGMPLVYFAAFKSHIGFYPTPSAITEFKPQLEKYSYDKGTVRFELDEPLPLKLIEKMIRFRVKENVAKANKKLKMWA